MLTQQNVAEIYAATDHLRTRSNDGTFRYLNVPVEVFAKAFITARDRVKAGLDPSRAAIEADSKLKELKEEEILPLLTDVSLLRTGDGPGQIRNTFKPVNDELVKHLLANRDSYLCYFSYPEHKSEEVLQLFADHGEKLHIRPIANPETDRGGASAVISFPRPTNSTMLAKYPGAIKSFERGDDPITFSDVRLGLQLWAEHKLEMSGAKWQNS